MDLAPSPRRRHAQAVLLAVLFCALQASGQTTPATAGATGQGGGSHALQTDNCIPPAQGPRTHARINQFPGSATLMMAPPPAGLQKYPFYPQAGGLWMDLFPNNFVDLSSASPDILDYQATAYTYDGHQGIDSSLCTFTEQSIGVPVFAALDGLVVDTRDGEYDMNTALVTGTPANYVVLNHGGTHETWYYHLKKDSVLVSVGQPVKAGQQLGLTASSGYSSGPHLHFESRCDGTYFEPFTGPANPGPSQWRSQPAFRSAMYVRDFNMTEQDLSYWHGPPIDTTRTGSVGLGLQNRNFWAIVQSLPANSTWHFRFLRPNGTLRYDSGTTAFAGGAHPFYKESYWWWGWNINYDVAGTWTVELRINGQVAVSAPIEVSATSVPNRPPRPVTATFDPAVAYPETVIFSRLPHRLVDDPDYNVVRYRYEWRRNGVLVRDSTNASLADALASGTCVGGDTMSCTVTPSDGAASAAPVTIQLIIRQRFAEWAAAHGQPADSHTADPDHDGLPNLAEYTLGFSPTARSTLPLPARIASGEYTWTLPLNPALDPNIIISVQTSVDLVIWTPLTPDSTGLIWTAGSSEDTKRFFRLLAAVGPNG